MSIGIRRMSTLRKILLCSSCDTDWICVSRSSAFSNDFSRWRASFLVFTSSEAGVSALSAAMLRRDVVVPRR